MTDIEYYYLARYSGEVLGMNTQQDLWQPAYHYNGYDHPLTPVVTSKDPERIQLFHWGLIPYQTRSMDEAVAIQHSTLMARSEDMYDKYAYSKLAEYGKRCLIPCSGYFEYHHLNDRSKTKIPFYIYVRDKPIFSIGGLYSKWTDPVTAKDYYTYTICTTEANDLVGYIHNAGRRMPVILGDREAEHLWLNPKLSRTEVVRLCEPIGSEVMGAYTVARNPGRDPQDAATIQPYYYPELPFNTRQSA